MKNPVSKLLLALALTTSSAAFVFSSANAAEGQSLTGKSNTNRIAVVDKGRENTRQIVVQQKEQKADSIDIAPVAKLERPPITQKIVVVDKGDEFEKTPLKQEETIEQVPTDIVENIDRTPELEKTPEIVDEDVFAPQVKTETVNVEMPTIFTERQQTLFKALSDEDQTVLVKGLIKKYGYNTLYPAAVASNNHETYSNYHSPRKYNNNYSNSYNNNYHSSNDNGYRYSNQSSYSNNYSNDSNGCAK
jgi:hypothetical protein